MRRFYSLLIWSIAAVVVVAAPARTGFAAAGPASPPGYVGALPPSPFESGVNGLGMGAVVGTAVGYLVARDDGLTKSDWRPILLGTGIGALAGGALGLTLGIVENGSPAHAGRGYLMMRDMAYGSEFGLFVGAIAGGLVALDTHRGEQILFGGAIGTVAGAGVGLLIGSVEHNPWAAPAPSPVTGAPPAVTRFTPTMVPYKTAAGGVDLIPGFCGLF